MNRPIEASSSKSNSCGKAIEKDAVYPPQVVYLVDAKLMESMRRVEVFTWNYQGFFLSRNNHACNRGRIIHSENRGFIFNIGKKWHWFRHLGYGQSGNGSPRNSHSGAQPLDCTFFRSCDSESWFNLFGGMDKKAISWDRPLHLFNDTFFFVKITFHQKFQPQKPSRWIVVQYLVDQPLWLLDTQDCGCSSFYLVQYL